MRKISNHHPQTFTPASLAGCIDHTLLKPEAGGKDIDRLCEQAIQYGFATVCIHPCHIRRAAENLRSQQSRVGSVVGFPFGTNHTLIKVAEAAQAIEDGADELDMVINLPAALENDFDYLDRDIRAVLRTCRAAEKTVLLKVIFETAALNDKQTKIRLCKLASDIGVDFIKTSTGGHPAGGATIEDIKLLYAHRGFCRVKAAGGIRDLETTQAMLSAGAARIGTSAGIAIVQELSNLSV